MKLRTFVLVGLVAIVAAGAVAAQAAAPELKYLGRATVRIVTASGFVVYVDPYAGDDYSRKAGLVLVTHGHADHNAVDLVTLDAGAVVAAPAGAVSTAGARTVKEGDTFAVGPVTVTAVPAGNRNHPRGESVGYLIAFDGMVVYHAGDTSYLPEMAALAAASIDYALFPTDGYWNMGGAEARKCADAVKPRFVAAIHSSPELSYDKVRAAKLEGPDVLPLKPGASIMLAGK